ncbi:MAG TPA: hypothetical protein VHX38_32480 [Pseudonocardiaceae bacterium]|nr:hypothetical protein [Pseudonocardiaceae bacterium]
MKEDSRPIAYLVLAVVGVVEVADFVKSHPVNSEAILLTVASLAIAAVFGLIRAYTVRLWREDGQLFRQGNAVTIALWIVGIGIHFGGDALIDSSAKGLSTTTIMLYLAISLGVQQVVVKARAGQLSRV